MTLPDFILVGAMKCGTSTLAAQLGAQDCIFVTTPKEPNYFSNDEIYAHGPDWYGSLFDAASPGDRKGEASTHYTKLPTYPETIARLKATGATPKIIYMVRDPLARAVSHVIHETTMGVITCPVEDVLSEHPEIIDYGRYAMQITPWIEAFGRENVLLLTMDAMKHDPQAVLTETGRFLALSGLKWRDDLAQMNASAERIRRFPLHGLLFDNPVAEALRRTLVPQSIRDRIKAARQIHDRPEFSPSQIAELKSIYRADHAKLAALFPGTDLSATYARVLV